MYKTARPDLFGSVSRTLCRCGFAIALSVTAAAAPSSAQDADQNVEVALVASLDEPRGYCLDIVGYKTRAQPAKGIQAHTCYSYQGAIATDQGFDRSALADGVLKLTDFDVCVTAADPGVGHRPVLMPCDGRSEQAFALETDGRIILRNAPRLCLTVDASRSRQGGGGNPPHLIRALTLEHCSAEKAEVQRWRTRRSAH